MHLTQVVATTSDSLHEVLLDVYSALGDVLHGGDCCIHRTITARCLGEGVTIEANLYGSCWDGGFTSDNLQACELYAHTAA